MISGKGGQRAICQELWIASVLGAGGEARTEDTVPVFLSAFLPDVDGNARQSNDNQRAVRPLTGDGPRPAALADREREDRRRRSTWPGERCNSPRPPGHARRCVRRAFHRRSPRLLRVSPSVHVAISFGCAAALWHPQLAHREARLRCSTPTGPPPCCFSTRTI